MSTRLQTQAKSPQPLGVSQTPGMALQRQCACHGPAGLSGACAECGGKKLQRRAAAAAPVAVPPVVHQVLSSAAQPLDAGTRSFMEPRFGHDFSKVRIHADGRSGEAAAAVSAHAFTVGRDVVFASGQYAPNTPVGRRLLTHELSHVVQQGSGSISGSTALELSPPGDRFEQEADRVADAVIAMRHGPPQTITSGAAAQLSRKALGLQRSASWVDTPASPEFDLAERVVNNLFAGNTDFVLNGKAFTATTAFADELAALNTPHINDSVRKDKQVECYFDSVPDNKGTVDMKVLTAGLWSFVTTKARLAALFGLNNCGAGDGTLVINGMQTNEDQRTRTQTHENQHLADDKKIFEDVVGAWDTQLAEAKRLRRTEVAATAGECHTNLYDRHVKKQDPTFIVTKLINDINAKALGFHRSALGRNVRISNAQPQNNCATVTAEAR